MSNSTYKFPNDVSTEAIAGATDWVNPDNVKASDDTNATCDGTKSYWLKCLSYLGFAAAIPATARIVGVQVLIEGGLTGIKGSEAYLCYKGERLGTDRGHNVGWFSVESSFMYGGSYDTWGLNLDPATVKDTSFGVHISIEGDGSTINIDSLTMQITFIEVDDTEVKICSEALGKIGEPPIIDLAGTDVRSMTCNLHYHSIRQMLLTSHIWQFAILYCKCERALTPPPFGWAYAYRLPSNFLKTSDIWPEMGKYEIVAGNVIYTDISDGSIRYITDVIDPLFFSKDFREALIYKLALTMHPALIDKSTTYQIFQKEALGMIRRAIHRGTVHQKPSRNTHDWTTELRI